MVFINAQNRNMRAPAEFGCEPGKFAVSAMLGWLVLWSARQMLVRIEGVAMITVQSTVYKVK